jgi:hypothetical protein
MFNFKINNEGLPNNFQYSGVEYEYDSYSCEDENCGCRDGSDYCRGSTYDGLRIKSVKLNDVRSTLLERSVWTPVVAKMTKNKIKETENLLFIDYCVDRLLRFYHAYDTSNWNVVTCGGYYGDEIDAIEFNKFKELRDDILTIIKYKPDERIEFILMREYGHVLPELVDLKWETREVPFGLLKKGGNVNYRKITKESKYDSDYKLQMGIYHEKTLNSFRLIDGYHRFNSLGELNDSELVEVIVGK